MFCIVMFCKPNANHVRFCDPQFRMEHKSTMHRLDCKSANYDIRWPSSFVFQETQKCAQLRSYSFLKFLHLWSFIWYLKHHAVATTARKIWSIFINVLIKMDNPVVTWGDSFSILLSRIFPRVFQRITLYRYFNKNSSIFTRNRFRLKYDDLYTCEGFRIK